MYEETGYELTQSKHIVENSHGTNKKLEIIKENIN